MYEIEYVDTKNGWRGYAVLTHGGFAKTVREAVNKAEAGLRAVRAEFGPRAGYRVLDRNRFFEAIGPSVHQDN
jgi:hypothetical protein